MKVFIFDLLAYGKHFDQYKATKYLPYPLANDHYDPEVAAQTYEQHLQAWEEMDKLGFDGVGLNEHHTTPHGMMNSPNMMAAVGAQRTKKLKFLMLGNLVPLHNPLRIAEELAMADTHVARTHSLGLRPRRAARIQRLWRADGGVAGALRGSGRDHPQGLDRAEVLLRGQVLVVQGHRDLAAAVSSSRIRRCGCRSPARRKPSSGPASTISAR